MHDPDVQSFLVPFMKVHEASICLHLSSEVGQGFHQWNSPHLCNTSPVPPAVAKKGPNPSADFFHVTIRNRRKQSTLSCMVFML